MTQSNKNELSRLAFALFIGQFIGLRGGRTNDAADAAHAPHLIRTEK